MDDIADRFFSDGILTKWPRKHVAKLAALSRISDSFDASLGYSEREVNEILKKICFDYVLIRRSLIDYAFFRRTDDGKIYTRITADKENA